MMHRGDSGFSILPEDSLTCNHRLEELGIIRVLSYYYTLPQSSNTKKMINVTISNIHLTIYKQQKQHANYNLGSFPDETGCL